MRTRHWVTALLFLAVVWSSSAAAQESGSIRGQAIDGTNGGRPVTGLEVTLTAYGADGSKETSTAQTDAEGSFRFAGLSISKGDVYQVTADYQGATYRSEALSFTAGQDELVAEVIVYQATENDAALRIERAHVVVDLASDGFAVTEMLLIRNDGDGTYVGSGPKVISGKAATLRFSLPPGAELVNIGESLMRCCIVATDDGFVDTMPVMPGTRTILYVYSVPYPEKASELRRTYAYPADRMDVFLSDGAALADVPGFSPAGKVEGQDSTYGRWTGGGLAAGEHIVIRLEGLPSQREAEATRAASTRKTTGWLLVTAAAIPLALVYPSWRRWQARSEITEAEAGVDETKESLLQRVADLDDAFEAGEISEAEYQVERAVLKQRLLALWDQDAAAEQESELPENDDL
jgi:hypothetical protein